MAGRWKVFKNQPGLVHFTLKHREDISSVHQFFYLVLSVLSILSITILDPGVRVFTLELVDTSGSGGNDIMSDSC